MIVLTADWHLRDYVQGRCPSMTGDAAFGLAQIVQFCEDQHPSALLALGDLLDSTRPDSRSARDLYHAMDRLQAVGVPVYYVQGQHELEAESRTWMGIHPWPVHIHVKTVEVDGVKIFGLDFQPRGSLREALDTIIPRDADVLATHQVWRDFIGSGECLFSDVPYVNYVLTGDYHVHQSRQVIGASKQPIAVLSPGTLCVQSFGEEFDKKFWVLEGNRMPSGLHCRSLPLRTRRYRDLYVGTPESLADAVSRAPDLSAPVRNMPDEVALPAVRIRYDSSVAGAHDELTKAFGGCHLFLEPLSQPAPDAPAEVVDESATMDDLLRDELARRQSEGLLTAARRLRDSLDPARDLAELEPTLAGG